MHQNLPVSVHCHNDFGLAVANAISGMYKQVPQCAHVTINGIGERAGNASLEEFVMALTSAYNLIPSGKLDIKTQLLYDTSTIHLKP